MRTYVLQLILLFTPSTLLSSENRAQLRMEHIVQAAMDNKYRYMRYCDDANDQEQYLLELKALFTRIIDSYHDYIQASDQQLKVNALSRMTACLVSVLEKSQTTSLTYYSAFWATLPTEINTCDQLRAFIIINLCKLLSPDHLIKSKL